MRRPGPFDTHQLVIKEKVFQQIWLNQLASDVLWISEAFISGEAMFRAMVLSDTYRDARTNGRMDN